MRASFLHYTNRHFDVWPWYTISDTIIQTRQSMHATGYAGRVILWSSKLSAPAPASSSTTRGRRRADVWASHRVSGHRPKSAFLRKGMSPGRAPARIPGVRRCLTFTLPAGEPEGRKQLNSCPFRLTARGRSPPSRGLRYRPTFKYLAWGSRGPHLRPRLDRHRACPGSPHPLPLSLAQPYCTAQSTLSRYKSVSRFTPLPPPDLSPIVLLV
jgi:hypothetical protein